MNVMETLLEIQSLEIEINFFFHARNTENIGKGKLSIGSVEREGTSMCYGKSCAITNHNVVRAIVWCMNKEISQVGGDVIRSTTIQ